MPVRVEIGVPIVAELEINDSRLFGRADPGERAIARGIIGFEEYLNLRRDPEVFVCFIPDPKWRDAIGDRMLSCGAHGDLFVVPVARFFAVDSLE